MHVLDCGTCTCTCTCVYTVMCYTCACAMLVQLMCLIGEGFGDSTDEVCGAVVQIRAKGDKMAIWTGNTRKGDDIMHIG